MLLLKAAISTDPDERSPAFDLTGFGFTLFPDSSNPAERHPGSAEALAAKFSPLLLPDGSPLLLTFAPSPHLSLFLTEQACLSYSLIHSCLLSFLVVRERLKHAWLSLGRRERDRRRWARDAASARVLRCCWEARRLMSWWIEEMVAHFCTNVIRPTLVALESQLGAASRLDFRILATLHALCLARLSAGLCLTEAPRLRRLLEYCSRLCEELEDSQLELLPPLLETNAPSRQAERMDRVQRIMSEFEAELREFFDSLSGAGERRLAGTSMTLDPSNVSVAAAGPGWMDEIAVAAGEGGPLVSESRLEASVFKRAVVSQLLARLDFSGYLSGETQREVVRGDECVLDGL